MTPEEKQKMIEQANNFITFFGIVCLICLISGIWFPKLAIQFALTGLLFGLLAGATIETKREYLDE